MLGYTERCSDSGQGSKTDFAVTALSLPLPPSDHKSVECFTPGENQSRTTDILNSSNRPVGPSQLLEKIK